MRADLYWSIVVLRRKQAQAGFTLLELILVVVVMLVLFTMGVTGWRMFLANRELQAGQDQLYQGIQQAQSQARIKRAAWQFSIQQAGLQVQWAVHPVGRNPLPAEWQNLATSIRLDGETSLASTSGIYTVQFNSDGSVTSPLGSLTINTQADSRKKRCVIVSTLLGSLRTSSDQPQTQNGQWCY